MIDSIKGGETRRQRRPVQKRPAVATACGRDSLRPRLPVLATYGSLPTAWPTAAFLRPAPYGLVPWLTLYHPGPGWLWLKILGLGCSPLSNQKDPYWCELVPKNVFWCEYELLAMASRLLRGLLRATSQSSRFGSRQQNGYVDNEAFVLKSDDRPWFRGAEGHAEEFKKFCFARIYIVLIFIKF